MLKTLFFIFALNTPLWVFAAGFHTGDYFLKGGESVHDDLYVVGGTATLGGSVVGDAVARRGPYWPGWDVAREISLTSSGNGYWVLDGLGGVHPTGDAPITGGTL